MKNTWLKYTLITLLSLLVLGLSLTGYLYISKDRIKNYALAELNKNLSTTLTIEQIDLSLFKQFPKVSLDLNQVHLANPQQPKSDLLFAQHVYIGFNIYDIIRKQFNIKLIAIDSATINLVTDKKGKHNFDVLKTQPNTVKSTSDNALFTLKEVLFKGVDVKYTNYQNSQFYDVNLKNIAFSGNFTNSSEAMNCSGLAFIRTLKSAQLKLLKNKSLTLDLAVNIDHKTQAYTIAKGNFDIDLLQLESKGSISNNRKGITYDLDFGARNLKIQSLLSLIPGHISLPDNLSSDGELFFSGSIRGTQDKKNNPGIDFKFGVKNGWIKNTDGFAINQINFTGLMTNGAKHQASTSSVKLNNFTLRIGSGNISGNLAVNNLSNPDLKLDLNGNLSAEDVLNFIGKKTIAAANGDIKFNIGFDGNLNQLTKTAWTQNQSVGELEFNLSNLQLANQNKIVKTVKAQLSINNKDVLIKAFDANIDQSDVHVSGSLINIIPYLLQPNQNLQANIIYQSTYLDLNHFMMPTSASSVDSNHATIALPEHISIKAQLKANDLVYNLFTAKNVQAQVTWKDKIITVDDLRAETMDGQLKLNGQIENAQDGRFLVTSDADLTNINITKLFTSCADFGQQEITQKHLKGNLSGTINIASVWSPELTCDLNKLYVLSKIQITNGELNGYEPLKALSKFIDVNDLEKLKFAEIKNSIEIKNKTIFIPQFDVKNNALNITLSGTHTFDNFVDYKLKLKLSELLKNKRKAVSTNNEFNEEEATADKGVNLYLSMKGPISNMKISYDKIGTKQKITQELKQEKQNIKEILKKELGISTGDKKESDMKEKKNDTDELEFEPD
jgi:hypothetical protein